MAASEPVSAAAFVQRTLDEVGRGARAPRPFEPRRLLSAPVGAKAPPRHGERLAERDRPALPSDFSASVMSGCCVVTGS